MNAQEWYAHETGELDEPEALLEDFEAHQSPLSAGDEGYMATTGAISKETPTPGEPPSTPEPRNSLEVLQALEALLEACPTSCEDRALIDAQRQAEQAIRRARV